MCQARALKSLERHRGKWLTTKEIAEDLDQGTSSLSSNLNKLWKQGLILRIENSSWVIPTKWKIK